MTRYAAALLWTALIFVFSSDAFSAPHTGSILQSIATAILGHPLSDLTYEMTQFVIRKLAHLTAYAILAVLWFRAVRGEERGWAVRWSVIAVLIAIAVAATDEFHQSFVPSRTGTPFDVVIDVCGAILAQIAIRAAIPEASARSSSPGAAD
jgi:VanZ family protein